MICRYKIKFISDIEQKIRKLLVNIAVAPFVGVWIEIRKQAKKLDKSKSLPSLECGLKSFFRHNKIVLKASLPSLECGLKFCATVNIIRGATVAPFVGVWIEII